MSDDSNKKSKKEGSDRAHQAKNEATQSKNAHADVYDDKHQTKHEQKHESPHEPTQQQKHESSHERSPDIKQKGLFGAVETLANVQVKKDQSGHRLEKQTYTTDAKGKLRLDSTVHYQYFDANGKPTTEIGKDTRAVATITDANGRLRHQYAFANPDAIEKQRPQQATEYRIDLEKCQTNYTNQSFDKHGNQLSKSEFTFDGKGMPLTFHYIDAQQKLDATVRFDEKGVPGEVTSAAGKLDEKLQAQLRAFAYANKNSLIESGAIGQVDRSMVYLESGPTAPRDGSHPASGTLVWKEPDGYHQATVRDGTVYDAQGKKLGAFADNGDVSLDGQPAFNILQNKEKMAAFHGSESTGRLDLCFNQSPDPRNRSEGFTGAFTNGKDTCTVVGGNIYDQSGKFIGHLGSNGKIEFDKDAQPPQEPKDVNSYFHGGWRFQGKEDGYDRSFDVGQKTANGKMFLPELDDTTQKPKTDGSGKPLPATQYEVRMGMIINPVTHEEIGRFIPPDDVNGHLDGGFIITGKPPKAIPLGSYSRVVFDVELLGQTGVQGRHITGLAAGAEVQADGTYRPGTGVINLQHQLDVTDYNLKAAKGELTEQEKRNWFFTNQWNISVLGEAQKTSADRTAVEQAQALADKSQVEVATILSSGQIDDATLARLQSEEKTAQRTQMGDGLQRQLNELNQQAHVLERMPADLSTMNGTLKRPDASAANGVSEYDVRNGKIYKKGTSDLVGSVDGSDGSMTWMVDGKPQGTAMRDMPGAVWHLEYPGEDKTQQKVDWITAADGTIYSAAQLRKQAAAETAYAKAFNDGNHSEQSEGAGGRGQELEGRFNARIDNIIANGVPADAATGQPKLEVLKPISDGPRKEARAELFREKEPPAPRLTSVPELKNAQDCQRMNGQARVGNNQFEIQQGKLYKVYLQNGQRVIDETACGEMKPGYVAEIDGHKINLNRENQVLLQFKLEGDEHLHRVIGMGPPRTESGGNHVNGGLIEANDLLKQSYTAIQEAQKGNAEYFKQSGAFADALMGYRGEHMNQLADSMQVQADAVKHNVDQLFRDGLSGKPMDNNMVDSEVRGIQIFMKELNMSAQDMSTLSEEGARLQKQLTEAEVMVAIAALTAGSGTAITTACTAFETTASAVTLYGGQILIGMVGGGFISAELRTEIGMDGSDQYWQNFASGVLEGGTMALGNIGGQYIMRLANLNKAMVAGEAITQADMAFLASPGAKQALQFVAKYGTETAQTAFSALNAVVQTTGFTADGGILDRNMLGGFTAEKVIQGSAWMFAGDMLAKALRPSTAALKNEGAFGRFIKNAPADMVNNFTATGLSAMHDAYQQESSRIAGELHVPVEALSNEMIQRYVNYQNIYNYMVEAGAQGAILTPIIGGLHMSEHAPKTPADAIRPVHPTVEYGPASYGGHQEVSRINYPDGGILQRVGPSEWLEGNIHSTESPRRIGEAVSVDEHGSLVRQNSVERTITHMDGTVEHVHAPGFVELRYRNHMTEPFIRSATEAISSIPVELRQLVQSRGDKFVLSFSLVGAEPSLRNAPMPGHGSATWHTSDGCYNPNTHSIVVGERFRNAFTGEWITTQRAGGVVRHEFGHALDASCGNVSESPEFMAIYSRERAAVMAKYDFVRRERLGIEYFVQTHQSAGASEAYAELFGTLFGESCAHQIRNLLLTEFPETYAFIQNQVQQTLEGLRNVDHSGQARELIRTGTAPGNHAPVLAASSTQPQSGPPAWYLFQQQQIVEEGLVPSRHEATGGETHNPPKFNEHLAKQMQKNETAQQNAAKLVVPPDTSPPTERHEAAKAPPNVRSQAPTYQERWEKLRKIQEAQRGSQGGTDIGGINPLPSSPSRLASEQTRSAMHVPEVEQKILSSITDPGARNHVRADIDHFLERMITKYGVKENMTREQEVTRKERAEQEVRDTLAHIADLVADHPNAVVSLRERQRLAEEIMLMTSMPTLVDQGVHPTCNVTVAEVRMYLTQPSLASRIVKEIALHGEFKDANGKVFKVRREMLKPDIEATRQFASATTKQFTDKQNGISGLFGKKVPAGYRLYANQLLQNALVEKHWSEQTIAPDGTTVQRGTIGFDGMNVINVQTGEQLASGTASMSSFDVQKLLGALIGKQQNFVLVNSIVDPNGSANYHSSFSDPYSLGELIKASNGHAGLTIQATNADGQSGPHFISVLGLRSKSLKAKPLPSEIIVAIDDQWGKGRGQMTLQELFDATLAVRKQTR